jgi:hypothetical protein
MSPAEEAARMRQVPEAVKNLLALYSFGYYWTHIGHWKGENWISVYRLGGHNMADFRIDGRPEEGLIAEIKSFLDWTIEQR